MQELRAAEVKEPPPLPLFFARDAQFRARIGELQSKLVSFVLLFPLSPTRDIVQ